MLDPGKAYLVCRIELGPGSGSTLRTLGFNSRQLHLVVLHGPHRALYDYDFRSTVDTVGPLRWTP